MAVAGARPVSPSRSAIAIVAFSFAGLMATRPIECVGLLVVVVACARRRALVAALVGVAGGALVLAAYDSVQFGGPFSTGYALYQTSFSRLYPAEGPAFSLSNIAFVREHLTQLSSFFGWCFPVWLFVPFGWTSLDSRQRRWLAALVVVPIATLQLMPPLAGDSYGPRYLLGLVLPMAWSAGRGVKTLQRRFGPIAPWTALAALLGCLGINSESMRAFGRQIDRRSKPLQVVEAAGLKRAIVLLPPNLGPYGAHWLVRNGATMDGPVLLAASGSSARDAQVLAWAAGREAYRLEGRGRTIRLRRIWSALNSIETP
jgi:hypothetical protein